MRKTKAEPGNAALPDDADEGEGALKQFHTRSFPGGAFVPGSLRAINPRRSDAAILNALLGTKPPERFPRDVLQSVLGSGFTGDPPAKERFREFVEEVWFPPNRGRMGNAGQEVLISHIKLGNAFRPKQHYGADRWALAILHAGGILQSQQDRADLRHVLDRAQQRTMNLVEKAFLDALLEGIVSVPHEESPPRLALASLNHTIGRLVRGLITQGKWPETSNDDAERIVLDIVALLRTGMYLNWILMHEQAFRCMMAFRKGQTPSFDTPTLAFGMSREKRSGTGRSFHETQSHLDMAFEEASFAIMALSQLHATMGWEKACWFDELAGEAGDRRPNAKTQAWFDDYARALLAENVLDAYRPEQPPTTVREAVWEMYSAISKNFRKWRKKDNTRFSHRSTIGAVTSMALAEGGALFAPGTGNRKHLPMIDLDLYLLVGRAQMSASGRTTARIRIGHELQNLGIRIDDETEQVIERELDRNGRIRKLSDAGESLYVRVD
ncbi:MAG: hypothetical protein ACYDBQ_02200 [Thermoplasmatota archaeon]